MQAIEDMSDSLNSLSQVISTSFMFAKSSPLKARNSLMSCAEYLQSKTFKSTAFMIRCFLLSIDLLKNENMEVLILTILSMIQSMISLLKSKEVQIIITQGIKLAASPDIAKLMQGLTKCAKSLFYIIKTPEIAKFQSQIMQLLEDETKKQQQQNAENNDNKSDEMETKIPGTDPINNIKEGYNNECIVMDQEQQQESKENDDNETPKTPKKSAAKTESSADTDIGGYYSPYKAWSGLTSFTTMFSGYNQESDDDDDDDDGLEDIDEESEQKEPVEQISRQQRSHSMNVADIKGTNQNPKIMRQRTLSVVQSSGHGYNVQRQNIERNHRNSNVSMNNGFNHVRMNNWNGNVNGGVDDWVDLVLYIDELEDNADISISEGEELRQLALNQMKKLLIVYKCYWKKRSRFMRYVRAILKDEREAKKLKEEEEKQKERELTESIPLDAENVENAEEDDEDDDDESIDG